MTDTLDGVLLVAIIVPGMLAFTGVAGVVPSWLVQRRGKPGFRPEDVRLPHVLRLRFRFALALFRVAPLLAATSFVCLVVRLLR